MKKITVEITYEDDVEIRRIVEDFCYGLQEDISPDISFIIAEEDDNNNVTV